MNALPNIPDQVVTASKANAEAAIRAAGIAFEGTERLIEFNLKAARAAFADGAKTCQSLANVKDVKALLAMVKPATLPGVGQAAGYARGVWEITSAIHSELSKLGEERATEFNKVMVAALDQAAKSGPAGSDVAVAAVKSAIAAANSAYDSAVKAAKQVADLTEANVAAATQIASAGKRKAA